MKIRLVGAEKLHAHGEKEGRDRQTDMMELIVPFSNFANAPTKPL